MSAKEKVKWTFFGYLAHDTPPLSIDVPRHLSSFVELNVTFEIETHIHNSKVVSNVSIENDIDIDTLRNLVQHDAQGAVDLGCFFLGVPFLVYFDAATSSQGDWQIFGAGIPFLFSRNAPDGRKEISSDLIVATGQDTQCQLILADFRDAMRVPIQTGFYCYRAIEAAMQSFRGDGLDEKAAWTALRQNLRVDLAAIQRVKLHADWARHGRIGAMTDENRIVVLGTTHAIIARYLEFVVGGRQPLDEAKYPQLAAMPVGPP